MMAVDRDLDALMARAFLDWARQIGFINQREWASAPLPPPSLRAITSHDVEERFLAMGLADAVTCLQHLGRIHPPDGRRMRVLDLGCGCGRVTRYLSLLETLECHGADVNPDLVQWCRENLPRVNTVQCATHPPLQFESNCFDLIAAVSVFTHLPDDQSRSWIEELTRVLTPGGLLVMTTHGYSALVVTMTSPPHQAMLGLDQGTAGDTLDRLMEEHFVFHVYPAELAEQVHVGGNYGNAFVDAEWVRKNWRAPGLEVVQHAPGGLRGFQDVVVFQRTSWQDPA